MKLLKTFLYILTIAGIVVFLYFQRNDLMILIKINPLLLSILLGVSILTVFFNALIFKTNISIFNIYLKFKIWFGLSASNSMYNYLLPMRGGMALRAIYLKNNHDFPYSKYLSYLSGYYILNFAVAALLALITGFTLKLYTDINTMILVISFLVFIFFLSFIFIGYKFDAERIPQKNKILNFIKESIVGLKQFKKNKSKVGYIILLQVVFILIMSVRLYLSYYALGIEIDFLKIILIQSFVVFSMVLSVTPGNIGIKEGIIGLSASLFGLSLEEALLGAVLDRMIEMIIIFILGGFYSKGLFKNFQLRKK
ncbi:MAG: lysylphosphatidylglycerol synthase transmembrane domain-containing protein [Bacteroidota bacterium]|nr:lysylphosphatidylglycerol synthase transmembrane domain-containing protein [Bacteroidota bacterium]